MAEILSVPPADTGSPSKSSQRSGALAEIHYGAVADTESNTPSEDEGKDALGLYTTEDAQGVIAVSIGHAQTRLTSESTPAAEKAAALGDIDGGGPFGESWAPPPGDEREESPERKKDETLTSEESDTPDSPDPLDSFPAHPKVTDARHEPADNLDGVPSTWRTEPKALQRNDETKQKLRESLSGRRRALSVGSTVESLKKFLPRNLPSMPKSPSFLNFSLSGFSSSSINSTEGKGVRRAAPSPLQSMPDLRPYVRPRRAGSGDWAYLQRRSMFEPNTSPSLPQDQLMAPSAHGPAVTASKLQRPPLRGQHSALRRSASYDSLLLYRSLSRASSLGDDTRFENVHKQLNARLKAIKDSWQDSSFRLPKTPTFNSTLSRHGSRRSIGNINDLAKTTASKRASTIGLQNQAGAQPGVTLPSKPSSSRTILSETIKDLTGDVVILGGYRGSILREAKPPHRQLWAPIKVGLNLRDVNLEVSLNPEDDETEESRIIPGGMLKNIGPVDISRRLFKRFRHSDNYRNGKLRVHEFGYDWRLNPNLLSRKLTEFLEKLACNKPGTPANERGAIVIAHSLGGLITRHAVNQRPELFSGVIYAGVPQTCVNILGPLRNGEDVLLSSKTLTAQVNFTMRTSYALLPLDGRCFFDRKTKEEYPIDFFDVQTWIDHRLSPVLGPPLPPLNHSSSGLTGIISSMSSVLPSLGRRGSLNKGHNGSNDAATKDSVSKLRAAAASARAAPAATAATTNPQMQKDESSIVISHGLYQADSPLTAVTIPREDAIAFLTRTLASVKQFKIELAHNPSHQSENLYPPLTVIYGKSIPTVYGVKVNGMDEIKRVTCYDGLSFASGDGVVLAKASMLPDGYQAAKGGVVSSERGHIGLLGDLEAVGRALRSIVTTRKKGVGLGPSTQAAPITPITPITK